MNYRDRVMDLAVISLSRTELRAYAAEIANEADAEIERLRAENAALHARLGNLLAVIHRDGGQYQTEHGTEKACADAETAVHVLRGSLDGYVEANRYMKGELDDALEDARKYTEAQAEIARLREALTVIAYPTGVLYHEDAVTQARAALAEVPK